MRFQVLLVWLVLILAVAPASRSVASDSAACAFGDSEVEAMLAAFDRLATAGVTPRPNSDALWSPPPFAIHATYVRAEFAVLMVRGLGLLHEVEGAASDNPFIDMHDHWAAGHVAVLFKLGIVQGDGGGRFDPDVHITLDQVKLMLARTLRLGTDLSAQIVDEALLRGGIDPVVPCADGEAAYRGQVFLLLDRAWSVSFYARAPVAPLRGE